MDSDTALSSVIIASSESISIMIRFLSVQVISESFFSDKNTASYRSTGTDWCKKITGSRSGDSFSFQHSVSVQILDSLTFDDHSTAVNLIQFFFQFQIRLHPDIGIQTFYQLRIDFRI